MTVPTAQGFPRPSDAFSGKKHENELIRPLQFIQVTLSCVKDKSRTSHNESLFLFQTSSGAFGQVTGIQALSTLWLFPPLSSRCSVEPDLLAPKFYLTKH